MFMMAQPHEFIQLKIGQLHEFFCTGISKLNEKSGSNQEKLRQAGAELGEAQPTLS